jgi:hypothetical protein
MPHAAEVHRFDMRAPERLKSHRTGTRPYAVAIARIPSTSLRLLRFVLTFRRFPQQENQRTRNGTRTEYANDVQDSDGYAARLGKAAQSGLSKMPRFLCRCRSMVADQS